MSDNTQTLIKEHKGKFYLFKNVMAESWYGEETGEVNNLSLKEAEGIYDSREEALEAALKLKFEYQPPEYGIQFEKLCKDNGKVNLIE